jgi:hypothetical protein
MIDYIAGGSKPSNLRLDEVVTKWEVTTRMGDPSAYGEIWQACENSRCSYVLKYIPIGLISPEDPSLLPRTKDDIVREIKLQAKISKFGLAPQVIDSWTCTTGGVIVMKSMKQTVNSLIRQYTSSMVRHIIVGSCLGIIDKLHSRGYYHGDSHLKNIMVDYKEDDMIEAEDAFEDGEVDEIEKYKLVGYRYYFIDLERSGEIKTPQDRIVDYEILTMDLNYLLSDLSITEEKRDIENIIEMTSSMILNMK